MRKRHLAEFDIVRAESSPGKLVIRDLNHGARSVTNDADAVVKYLLDERFIHPGGRLFYYDSESHLDELLYDEKGFKGFKYSRSFACA